VFFFQAEDGIRDLTVTGVQTCALPIYHPLDHRVNELKVARVGRDGDLNLLARGGLALALRALMVLNVALVGGEVRVNRALEGRRSEERRVGKEGRTGVWTG